MYIAFKIIDSSAKDKLKMENKRNYSNSLSINVNGQKVCIDGITRYTTCDDVIEMMFYNSKVETESYAVFESSYGIERMLYGKESILKVVRSWGADKNNFSLLIRKVDNIKSNMATISQARRKFQKMRSQNVNTITSKNNNYTLQANLNQSCNKQTVDKDIKKSTSANNEERYTKLGLLKRFLSDVMLQKKKHPNQRSGSRMTLRTPGDGCSEILECQRFPSHVENDTCNNDFNNSKCLALHHSFLNAAFVDGDNTPDNDTVNDETTDNDTIAFNKTCILIDTMVHVADSISSDNESAFEEESICELERNISESSDSDSENSSGLGLTNSEDPFYEADNTVRNCERIIDIFRTADVNDAGHELEMENDYLESFMNTVVYHSDSDEGMGSLESDTE